MEQELKKLRKEIDAIDAEIILLMEKRVDIAKEIGALKKKGGLPVSDPEREKEVLVKAASNTNLDKKFVENIYKALIEYCKDEERK